MRFQGFVLHCSFIAGLAIGRPLQHLLTALPAQRDLIGLLGDGLLPPTVAEPITTTPGVVNAGQTVIPPVTSMAGVHPTSISSAGIERVLSTSQPALRTPTTPTTGNTPSPTPITNTPSVSADPSSSDSLSSTSTGYSYVGDASNTPPGELTEWKVIGIAVITVTLIAMVILSVTFFDSWWGFLRAAVCGNRGKKRGLDGVETMVPDWEKKSWEFRLANEDGHRYPTLASLESIVKEKDRLHTLNVRGSVYGAGIAAPELAYGAV